jgi:hypothetical protein
MEQIFDNFHKDIMQQLIKTVTEVALRYNVGNPQALVQEILAGLSPKINAVQQHGFEWEDQVKKVYMQDLSSNKIPYTSKIDLPASLNKVNGVDLSIKTTGNKNSVCMGDALRQFDLLASGTPYHMVVVHYNQVDGIKKLAKIVEVDLTGAKLFGSLTRAQIEKLDTMVKAVPQKRKPTPEEHTAYYAFHKTLVSGPLSLAIKCNSSQSRLQVAFVGFEKYLEDNPKRVIAESTTGKFQGGVITEEIMSPRRKLKQRS